MIKTAIRHRINAYRNPVYVVYFILGIILFFIGAISASKGIGPLETYIFRAVNELPSVIEPIFSFISLAGTIGFVLVISIVALIRKHYAHATKFLLGGVSAWLIVKWIKTFEIRERPFEILQNVKVRENIDSLIGYPSGHAAVSTVLAVLAYQYIPKRYHKFVTWLVVLVWLSRLYLGMHLPVDIIGGFAVGLAIGSLLNFTFGNTQGKFVPTNLIKSKLKVLHLDIASVKKANLDARGSTPFIVELKDGGRVFVKVVDTTNNVADWLFKITRKVVYRKLRDESPFLTPKQQLEHEAYVAELSRANGIKTPKIYGIFHVNEDMWGMAQEMIDGSSLDKFDASQVSDKMLIKIWQLVNNLHDHNIIHRDLRAANIFIDDNDTPWLIDFGFAEASVDSSDFHRDTVELIASLSCLVNYEKVIESAVEVLGKNEVLKVLPYLSYASLSGATTKLIKSRPGLLDMIRKEVGNLGANIKAEKIRIKRFDFQTILYIVMIIVLFFVIAPSLSFFRDGIETAKNGKLEYLILTALFSAMTYPAAAATMNSISPHPLKYLKTLLITITTSFTNRLLPASTGAAATNVRYLTKSGYTTTQAGSIVALNNLIGFIGHITILFIVAGLSNTTLRQLIVVPISTSIMIAIAIIFASITLTVIILPRLRSRAIRLYKSTSQDLKVLFKQPSRFAFAIFSAMTLTSCYAFALYFSTLAIGQNITVLQAFYVITIGIAAASVTPTPGGIGGTEAALVAAMVSVGISSDAALAATMIYRLFTFWLPIVPGIFAFRHANRKYYI